ncbi:hypothetical protein [Limisalsivibrio acetivorans]|uniref:hypothetical protein n=1 Tax=Limisalsivibrio acetivorans TaxID=1304888 RepID=UPI0003B5D78F|nr:hypothetical protein [Limisalsivibrio acetivorans]
MHRIALFMVVSILAHLVFFLYLPAFDINLSGKQDVVEVQILPPKPKILPKPPVNKPGKPVKPPENPVKVPKPSMALPDVDVPRVDVNTDVDVTIPDIQSRRLNTDSEAQVDEKLLAEIETSEHTVQDSRAGEGEPSDIQSDEYENSDFFVMENITNVERKLAYIPPRPSFSLQNDTKMTVRFKIDKEGKTYAVIPITRTDKKIEQLAIDFVSRLRFNAVRYAKPDQAEMTLYFRVR